ncbi:MAG: hypothetical protein Q8R49_03320 [Rhodoferax sp.]|nr:hypothetical protein [Rhodoferax sp.]
MKAWLAALSRHGPAVLAAGVLLGLAWPALAALAKPGMGAAVFCFLLGSFLRLDLAQARRGLAQWRLSLLAPLWLMLALPLGLGLLARALGLESSLALALALACAAPPSSGNAALARMLGMDADSALLVTLIAMLLAPLTLPLVLSLLGAQNLALDPGQLAQRLLLMLGASAGLAWLWRRLAGAALQRQALLVDAGVLLALVVFALATMAGVRELLLADPRQAGFLLSLAYASNLTMQLLTGLFMPGPRHLRLTLALTGGNRNVGLIWSALGAALSPAMALYFACTQLPIYTLPRLLQALLARLNR